MRQQCIDFVTGSVDPSYITGKDVIESGALDMNGSIRPLFEAMKPKSYLGTDMQSGPGVDEVCKAEDLTVNSADFVVCIDALEHAENWRGMMQGLVQAVRDGGYLLITVPGPNFPRHNAPGDYQRFTVGIMRAIMDACGMEVICSGSNPGFETVYINGTDPMPVDVTSVGILGKKVNPNPNFADLLSVEPYPVPHYGGLILLV